MLGLNWLASIAAICTLGQLLLPTVANAQPLEAVSAASDAAAAASDAAAATIEIPYFNPGSDAKYVVTFLVKEDPAKALIFEHKKMCEALGSSRCQVEEFAPKPSEYGTQTLSLRLRLAPGTAPAMIASLGKNHGNAGYRVERSPSHERSENNRAELTVRRALLVAQQEKLSALTVSAPADQRSAISGQSAQIQTQLARIDSQLSAPPTVSRSDVLSISYGDPNSSHRSGAWRKVDELLTTLGLAFLAVPAVALLTALYFAIMGLSFLWIRRFARRRGLVEDPQEPAV